MTTLLLTCTSGRPEVFPYLSQWIDNQTTDDFSWLVVSDNWEGYKFPKRATVVKRDNTADTLPSLNHNMLEAVAWVEKNPQFDKILVLEDDDFYAPSYVKETREMLASADLVGWNEDAYYYVLSRKARRLHNTDHASLAATGFTRAVLSYLKEVCLVGDVYIDKLLWTGIRQTIILPQIMTTADGKTVEGKPIPCRRVVSEWKGRKQLADNFTGILVGSSEIPKLDARGNIAGEFPRHVGMKQNWHKGFPGLSVAGHDSRIGGAYDPFGDRLIAWMGEANAKKYLRFTEEAAPSKDPQQQMKKHGGYPHSTLLPLPT